ncbi:MAG TPA: hypothetical protein DCS48_06360 [Desulfovibrio sp.]|nr:hypothetical protein [Desulfovibrio sp.]
MVVSRNVRFIFFYGSVAVLCFGAGVFCGGLYWLPRLLLFICGVAVLGAIGLRIKTFIVDEKERRTQFASLIAANCESVFYQTDLQGNLLFADNGCRVYEQRLSGRATLDESPILLAHLSSSDFLKNFSQGVNTRDGIYRFEVEHIALDGKKIKFAHALQYTHDAEGKVDGIVGTVSDISEEETLKAERDQQARYLDTVMNGAESSQFIHDLEGNFIKVNKKFADYSATTPELCKGTSVYHYLSPQIADNLLQRLSDLASGGKELSMQIPAFNPRGEKRPFDVRFVLCRDGEDEPEAIVGFAREAKDFSPEPPSAGIDLAFMESLCHEMRTPLAGIIGSLHVLDNMDLSPEAREYVRKCALSAERFKDVLNTSLNDLAGNIDPRKVESLSPAAILEKHIELFAPAASIQNRSIGLRIGSGVPDAIICNRKELSKIVFCLINEGLEIITDLDITVGVKRSTVDGSDSWISFYVTGEGGDTQSSQGLYSDSLEKNAAIIGGKPYFDETPVAEFGVSIEIPVGRKSVAQDSSSVQELRIILAEDDISSQVFMRKKLESWGHLVRTASTGIEVLNYMEGEEFDLILMDLQMPKMNGFDAITSIREGMPSMRNLPIIVMSAYGRESDFAKMSELKVDDYISKPVSTEQLSKALERLCALGRI